MVRLQFSIELGYEVAEPGCDFIFNVHAAQSPQQTVISEQLNLSQQVNSAVHTDPRTHGRFLRVSAQPGLLVVSYSATVEIRHHLAVPQRIREVPVAEIPGHVMPYLYPSRYCQSDRLLRLAFKEFAHLRQGYARVAAIREWVQKRVEFRSGVSDANTSAIDTLVDQAGVCRDFAHLMIALCRAVNIPARFATGIDYGADPALGPTDFHAYVEAWLGDRWFIFDPSGTAIPMGFVRFTSGLDAADAAFATMFGAVQPRLPVLSIRAVPDDHGNLLLPYHTTQAISTDEGLAIRTA